jgi:hypothetical protein
MAKGSDSTKLAISGDKKQDVDFFAIVRLLNNTSLDPNFDLDNDHVIVKECTTLFGGRKFKMKSIVLKLVDKLKVTMEEIYWRVFGTYTIINKDMLTWIVCGYIAQKKGLTINWARVVESIAKKNTCKDKVKDG